VSRDRTGVGPSGRKLPAQSLLRKKKEFDEVYQKGTPYRGRYIVLIALVSAGFSERKVGFVASKKVGGAVKRNRVRRLMKEAFRRAQPQMADAPGRIVFIARSSSAEAGYHEVEKDLRSLLTQASLLAKAD
jgi:ribonuclease P protein component